MCLLVFSYKHTPGYNLILAGNRDEFFSRPTAPLSFWEENDNILAGRDLERGGTWLGLTRSGKIGALTNYRELNGIKPSRISRGEILTRFFTEDLDSCDYLDHLSSVQNTFQGFNLLIGDTDSLYYFSNRNGEYIKLQPGIYGLSNHLLNTKWPKTERAKQLFSKILGKLDFQVEELLDLLTDSTRPADEELPHTGVGLEWERLLSTIFISSATYGTRTSAIITIADDGEIQFCERTHDHNSNQQIQTAGQRCFTIMGSFGKSKSTS